MQYSLSADSGSCAVTVAASMNRLADSMADFTTTVKPKCLSRYGKVLLVAALTIMLCYESTLGPEHLTWQSSGIPRRLGRYSGSESQSAPGALIEPTEVYTPPEGIFNPELPRGRLLDIVLAYYKGDVHRWDSPRTVLKQHEPFWIMYRKDQVDQDEEIWDEVPMNRIYRLPNVGREGHTFVHPIVENFDNLADHTLFCQEDPHYPERIKERMRDLYRNSTGMMGLSGEMPFDCDGNRHGYFSHLSSIWGIFRQEICDKPYLAVVQGCFIVSRRRIQSHDIKLYRYMEELMEKGGDQFVREVIIGNPNKWPESNPALGHVLERSWSFIFDCYALDGGPPANGQQCLDEDSPVDVKAKGRPSRRLSTDDVMLERLRDYVCILALE